jgi:hypothetical protein
MEDSERVKNVMVFDFSASSLEDSIGENIYVRT